MPRSGRCRPILVAVLVLPVLAVGCAPLRLSVGVGPDEPGVRQTVVHRDREATAHDPKVALFSVSGLIADSRRAGVLGSQPSAVDRAVALLKEAESDPQVRAVVIRINSPGGTVTGSDILYREIRAFRERSGKPVVASMGEVAASGGFYIALAADRIYAEPTTITASIGVIIQTINISDGLSRLGVRAHSITSGPNKAMGSPLEPEQDRHTALLRQMVEEFYGQFTAVVFERRPGLEASARTDATDGRIMTGADAQAIGLVDSTGGVLDAYEEAKRLARLDRARFVALHDEGPTPRSPFGVDAPAFPAAAESAAAAPGATQITFLQLNTPNLGLLDAPGFYYLWLPGVN